MHSKCLVLFKPINIEDVKTEAKGHFENMMAENHSYDWYVIGGRWSGCLTNNTPKGTRDTYKQDGYKDDAQPLTAYIYDKHLKEYAGLSEWRMGEVWRPQGATPQHKEHVAPYFNVHLLNPDYATINKEELLNNKYWAVIIDYHN